MDALGSTIVAMATWKPLGDTAFVIRLDMPAPAYGGRHPAALAEAIARDPPHGTLDIVPARDSVTVFFDGAARTDPLGFMAALERITNQPLPAASDHAPTVHEIPVEYGGDAGPDLEAVCARHGLDRAGFIALHTQPEYVVEAIGFAPGFPYLAGLPAALATPRRDTPRLIVPAGSVGIGGSQTGIYSCATPGGWQIVGRTAARLFDPGREPAALLRAGDRVRFVDIAAADAAAPASAAEASPADALPAAGPAIRVGRPGLMTTIQDLGRPGHRAAGVPLSGAADPLALRLANLIVGNDEHAAGIECTLVGPELTFEYDAVVAFVGGDFSGLPGHRPVHVAAGETLAIGHARQGCRGYLAIAGGVLVEPQLGSRSTFGPAGLGGIAGAPLRDGARIPIKAGAPAVRGRWAVSADLARLPAPGGCKLRFIPAAAEQSEALAHATWRTSSRSDRMGVRLEGAHIAGGRADLVSAAVIPGTIQLPPDGHPIILLADAQTIGGYTIVGHVITADLRLAAQLRPGAPVTFAPVTLDAAHAAFREQEQAVDDLRHALAGRIALPGRDRSYSTAVDLNCDLGEGMEHDAALMPLISSANIACGGHAGDDRTMVAAVALARQHRVAIGAHPGYVDRIHFGRREHPLAPDAAAALVLDQIAALAAHAGDNLHHVKLHGALYHQVDEDDALAAAVAAALRARFPGLVVYARAGSALAKRARAEGLAVAKEAFIDRAYRGDGRLVPRSTPGAVITDVAAAADRARRLVGEGCLEAIDGSRLAIHADTLCIHGDAENPVAVAAAVRDALARAGVSIRPPCCPYGPSPRASAANDASQCSPT
jgi:KipI family sensor histidine kinase inhibitor